MTKLLYNPKIHAFEEAIKESCYNVFWDHYEPLGCMFRDHRVIGYGMLKSGKIVADMLEIKLLPDKLLIVLHEDL